LAHNSYIRAGAVWANASPVTSAEFNLFDVAQFKSINGDDGGSWSPASAIVLGGSGLNVTGDSVLTKITGSFVTGALTVSTGSLVVNDNAVVTINGDMTLGATGTVVYLSGSTSTWNSGAVFACAANATFTGTLTLNTTSNIVLGSASVDRLQQGTPYANQTNWLPQTGSSSGTWTNQVVGTAIELPLDLPDGSTLTSVSVYVTAASGHAALPAVMPAFQLRYVARTGGVSAIGAGAVDSSGTVAAFEANHAITLSGLTEVTSRVSAGGRYIIELTAESGANSAIGLRMTGWTATYTVTKYDRGLG